MMITTINQDNSIDRETAIIVKIEIVYPCSREEDESKYLHHRLGVGYIYSPKYFDEIKALHIESLERQVERQIFLDAYYTYDGQDEEDKKKSHVPALKDFIAQMKKAVTLDDLLSTKPECESLRKTYIWSGISTSRAIK